MSRRISREEGIRVGKGLEVLIAKEFGPRVVLDESTHKGEQPVFVPPAGAVLFDFEGEPVPVDELLELLGAAHAGGPATTYAGGQIPEGGRNHTLTKLGGAMRRQGATEHEIHAALGAANAQRCVPPLSDAEVRSIAASMARYEPKEQPTRTRANGKDSEHEPRLFPRFWLDDALSDIDAPYAVKGLIEPGRLSLIYGPSGDGKTFFAIDLACHIASGMSWRGLRVRRCLVVYVAAEAGAGIARRFFAWREQRLGDAREGRVPLVVLTRGANLLDEVEVAELIGTLKAIAAEAGMPVGLVFIDTLSRSIPGGLENAPEDMSKAIGVADLIRDELAAGTVFIHHTGKDAARGSRGHTSLPGAADTVISVIERVATVEKVRDGRTDAQFPFELEVIELGLDQDGDMVTTCVVEHKVETARAARPPKLTGVGRIAFDALREVITERGSALPQTSAIPPGRTGVTEDLWRERFGRRYGTEEGRAKDTIAQAYRRGKEQLLGLKLVGMFSPYCWIW
jgi:hypothetical protein